MINPAKLPLFLLLLLLITAGCWDYFELEQRGIVCCAGIDRAAEAGKMKMTVSVIRPGEISSAAGQGGDIRAKSAYYTATGYTISDTTRNFAMQSSRKLMWDHNRNIIISEAVAREGIFRVVDRFTRVPEQRLRAWIFIADGAEAKEIVETVAKMEDGPGPELEGLISNSLWLSAAPRVDLKFFNERLNSKTAAAVAPRLELIRAGENTDAGDYPGTSGPAGAAEPKLQRLHLTGTAVFKGDRLAGWLNKPESRGLLWVLGKIQSGMVVVKCPGDEDNLASLELKDVRSKIKPEKKENKMVITVEITTQSTLDDVQGITDLSTPEALLSLQRRHAAVVKNEILAALEKARRYEADIFAFGEAIGRRYPKEWKAMEGHWDELFPELEVELKIKSRILSTGLTGKPTRP